MENEKLSKLEQFALDAILALDTTRTLESGMGVHYIREYPNRHDRVFEAAMQVAKERPNVAVKVADYFLDRKVFDKPSERIVHAVYLLEEIGDEEGNIAQKVVEAIWPLRIPGYMDMVLQPAFTLIERYHSYLGDAPHRKGTYSLKEKNPRIHKLVIERLAELFSPIYVREAITGLWGNEQTSGIKDRVKGVVRYPNSPERKYLPEFIQAIEEDVKKEGDWRRRQTDVIQGLLNEFEGALGKEEFESRGYADNVRYLQGFNATQDSVSEEIGQYLQHLSKEREKKKQPWYKSLLRHKEQRK